MDTNIGTLDRTLRIAAGLILIGAALGIYGVAYTTIWGWIGLIPLATGLFGYCPVYGLLGTNTCPKPDKQL